MEVVARTVIHSTVSLTLASPKLYPAPLGNGYGPSRCRVFSHAQGSGTVWGVQLGGFDFRFCKVERELRFHVAHSGIL